MSLVRFILVLLVTICLVSCQEDPISTNPEDLRLQDRQDLGDVLLDALKGDLSNISYYPEESFPQLYEHFDELYRQVYQIDRESIKLEYRS